MTCVCQTLQHLTACKSCNSWQERGPKRTHEFVSCLCCPLWRIIEVMTREGKTLVRFWSQVLHRWRVHWKNRLQEWMCIFFWHQGDVRKAWESWRLLKRIKGMKGRGKEDDRREISKLGTHSVQAIKTQPEGKYNSVPFQIKWGHYILHQYLTSAA